MPEKPALTKLQKKRLEMANDLVANPNGVFTFMHAVLCQTTMPYKDPGDNCRLWSRRNGKAVLRVEAGHAVDPATGQEVALGLPFGPKPRLILAHLNAQALRTDSPEIDVDSSLTAFVRRLGLAASGYDIRMVKDQLSRLAAGRFGLGFVHDDRSLNVNTNVISYYDLWLTKAENQRVLWPSVVRLSLDYFENLREHAVPLQERALAVLAPSPMALDIYAWLAHRLPRINYGDPQGISWAALKDQFGHGYKRERDFRSAFIAALRKVELQYPGANFHWEPEGVVLSESPPPVPPKRAMRIHDPYSKRRRADARLELVGRVEAHGEPAKAPENENAPT